MHMPMQPSDLLLQSVPSMLHILELLGNLRAANGTESKCHLQWCNTMEIATLPCAPD